MRKDFFIFGGVNSLDYGVLLDGSGTTTAPERDVMTVTIPGRSGDLLVCQLYVYYLCAQIDMQNQEFDLYQNNAALYNKAYSDYASYYNRKIMPASEAKFNAWGVR